MKKVSIVMSFVAVLAAGAVFGLALYRDKWQSHVPKTDVPKVGVAISTDGNTMHSGHVIFEPKDEVKLPPVAAPKVQPIPVEVPTPSVPFVGPSQPLQAQPPEILYTADSSVKFAVGDLLTIPFEDQKYIRYFSLYNIPKAKRREYAAVFSFVCNSLSTRRKMYIPEFVGASDETVIRVDIRNYNWKPEPLEKLGLKGSGVRPFPEPYFHYVVDKPITEKVKVKKKITEKVPWKDNRGIQYVTKDGKPAFKEVEKEVEVEEIVANRREYCPEIAPWLDPLANKTLYTNCCTSFPIYRLDWFVANVIVPPAYFDLLGLGNNIKDFEKLAFANEELAKLARAQDKAVVIASIVARNNRTLIRSPTFTGGYIWGSKDSLKSVDDRDYVKNLLNETFDATEDIASLPNGLQFYFLTDGKGTRLDEANPNVAVDNTAVDRVVRTGRSCMICHADGIRPINDEIRSLTRKLQDPKQVQLLITRKEDAFKIDDLFSSDLDEQIIKDQNYYRAAVARATGLQSEVVSKTLNEIYNNYVERLMTIEDISREMGINVNGLDAYIKASKDNVVLGLLKTPTRPIRRDQWETCFGRFEILIGARKQGLDHADPYPVGPLIDLNSLHK
jgi:hypothetical protein